MSSAYFYIRTSTIEQNFDLQVHALQSTGIKAKETVTEKTSTKFTRKKLDDLLSSLEKDDTLVIWKLDRIGRSTIELIKTVTNLEERGIHLFVVTQNIDTKTPEGRYFMRTIANLAEFERDMIQQRTKAGLAAAKAQGRIGGRPSGMNKEIKDKCELIHVKLQQEPETPIAQLLRDKGMNRHTWYKWKRRYLDENNKIVDDKGTGVSYNTSIY